MSEARGAATKGLRDSLAASEEKAAGAAAEAERLGELLKAKAVEGAAAADKAAAELKEQKVELAALRAEKAAAAGAKAEAAAASQLVVVEAAAEKKKAATAAEVREAETRAHEASGSAPAEDDPPEGGAAPEPEPVAVCARSWQDTIASFIDPATKDSVTPDQLSWAKEAKGLAGGSERGLIEQILADNSRREALFVEKLEALEKQVKADGPSDQEKEAENREFVPEAKDNDWYHGQPDHLRGKGGEPKFASKWEHVPAILQYEKVASDLGKQGKSLQATAVCASLSAEHLKTLCNVGAVIENVLVFLNKHADIFGDLNQKASDGKREFCETPEGELAQYIPIAKVYNTLLALQENLVRPRVSLVILGCKTYDLCKGASAAQVLKYSKAYEAAEHAIYGDALTADLPPFFDEVVEGAVELVLEKHRLAAQKSIGNAKFTGTNPGSSAGGSNFSKAAAGKFGATPASWSSVRKFGTAAPGSAAAASSSGAMVVRR